MARSWILLAGVWVGLVGVGQGGHLVRAQEVAGAQTPAKTAAVPDASPVAKPASAKRTCRVDSSVPTPAETALNKGQFSEAGTLFRAVLAKSTHSDAMHEGLIRALIEQDKVVEAAKDVEAWVAVEPENSMALIALGDVRLRQGNPLEAYTQYQQAAQGAVGEAGRLCRT